MDALNRSDGSFDIALALVSEPDVAGLIEKHFDLMRRQSPPDACHVMSADGLAKAGTYLLVLRQNGAALAIGALRRLGKDSGEIKSMHTARAVRGRGCARALLRALISHARAQKMTSLFLETGSGDEHAAARALYASEGFSDCPPFGNYSLHPLSVYMARDLTKT